LANQNDKPLAAGNAGVGRTIVAKNNANGL
jgi:hypothetical protein